VAGKNHKISCAFVSGWWRIPKNHKQAHIALLNNARLVDKFLTETGQINLDEKALPTLVANMRI